MKTIYLDYNATTPLDREVIEAMQPVLSGVFGNPSSLHTFGFDARKVVEDSRLQVAEFLKCKPEEIVFTSGGSEANNFAIKGIAMRQRKRGRHIITSAIEHPATLEACRFLETEGFEVSYVPVDARGRIRVGELRRSIRGATVLITVMNAVPSSPSKKSAGLPRNSRYRSTPMQPRVQGKSRLTWGNWGWTCSHLPGINSMGPRA
jgi:cysteine desulfurase